MRKLEKGRGRDLLTAKTPPVRQRLVEIEFSLVTGTNGNQEPSPVLDCADDVVRVARPQVVIAWERVVVLRCVAERLDVRFCHVDVGESLRVDWGDGRFDTVDSGPDGH